MSKLSHLSLAILIALPVLAGCSSMQPPSPGDTTTGAGAGVGSNFGESPAGNESLNGTGLENGSGSIPADLMNELRNRNVPADQILVTVYFDFNEYSIRADQRAQLEAAAKTLAGDPSQRVVSVGYTDWYGSEQYDLALGDRRANSVKTYATQLGASAGQIDTLSLGKLNAPTNVAKDSPEAKNSRVVLLVKLPASGNAPATATP
jgi:peptidoglycan-associated lipoprotein